MSRTIYFESELNTTKTNTERIIEICKKLKADTYLSGSGGKAYLEEDRFMQEGIELKYQDFQHPTYAQNFSQDKSDFIPCMSIADLLFNAGLKSREILKAA